jgi:hypothetical protein
MIDFNLILFFSTLSLRNLTIIILLESLIREKIVVPTISFYTEILGVHKFVFYLPG